MHNSVNESGRRSDRPGPRRWTRSSTRSLVPVLGAAAFVVSIVTGCGSAANVTGPPPTAAPPTAAPTPSLAPSSSLPPRPSRNPGRPIATIPPSSGQVVSGEVPADLLEAIVADAAGRFGVGADQVEALQDEQVIWNNGSLGCPRPGQYYTQALVPGYRVVVAAGGDELDYRATDRGTFIVCESPIP